jgi:formylmethanofuran dehydrogenase subunit A
MTRLRIEGGRVVDPANGIDAVRDVWIEDGVIVAAPENPSLWADRTIDARGDIVMPGGVDVHCHIAGPKVNAARVLRPEDRTEAVGRRPGFRSGAVGSVPTSFATGYRYAGLGYTTALDAAVPPLGARLVHHELDDTPVIDKAFLVLMGNNQFVLDRVGEGDHIGLRDFVAWQIHAAKAFGIKVVNPGGVERWKQGARDVATLDDAIEGFGTGVTPRTILTGLARAAVDLKLPHPVHVHGLNLGLPGNATVMMETMKGLDGLRAHLAHVQFHSYAGDPSDGASFGSGVAELASYLDEHDGLTVDVGQVLFGETTSMTADGAVGAYLARLTGRKWHNHDVELETGCGVVPITYAPTNVIHAWQWSIGLEWLLSVRDPWKVALSTDHPNGGSFLSYPRVIAWLMSRNLRDETLATLPESVRTRVPLAGLDREYTLSEVAIVTRAGPARILGLGATKGQLGPGADADVTIYRPNDDVRQMFELPRWALKAGRVVIDDGELVAAPEGVTLFAATEHDRAIEARIAKHFHEHSSIQFSHVALREEETPQAKPVMVGGQKKT